MRDISKRELSTTIVGEACAFPAVISPTGMSGILHGTRAEVQAATDPSNPNGWYFQAYALGRYSQGISVAKALAQGLGSKVKDALENYYRVQWWADPTDVYGKSQDQRMFYTMPSTSIPNDQASFQDWLFKIPSRTCKEGNRDACTTGTNGGAIPWLSQPN